MPPDQQVALFENQGTDDYLLTYYIKKIFYVIIIFISYF